jgi:hypothetical protein
MWILQYLKLAGIQEKIPPVRLVCVWARGVLRRSGGCSWILEMWRCGKADPPSFSPLNTATVDRENFGGPGSGNVGVVHWFTGSLVHRFKSEGQKSECRRSYSRNVDRTSLFHHSNFPIFLLMVDVSTRRRVDGKLIQMSHPCTFPALRLHDSTAPRFHVSCGDEEKWRSGEAEKRICGNG